jgi:asparagine N-glycosylation enzyme membrane subunit Stt3
MKYLVWFALAFAFVTHIVIPWHNVFQSSVVLATPDAYSMLYCADNGIYSWEGGVGFFAAVIVAFGQMFHLSNVVSEAVLPPILFFLTLIPLYLIAKTIFNKTVAVGALVIYCLLPGELLERTKLGAGDYHCWEIFIFTAVMMFVVLAIKSQYWRRYLCIFGAVFMLSIYQLALLKVILAPLIIIAAIGLFAFLKVKGWLWRVGAVVLCLVGVMVAYLVFPVLFGQALSLVTFNLTATTNEMMPLFFTAGQFDTWVTAWNYFGAVFFFSLFGLGWLIYRTFKHQQPLDVLFLVWTLAMLWLTIVMRRSAFYYATNIAILTSIVVYEYGKYWVKNKERLIKYAIVIGLIVCAPLMTISVRAANEYGYAPSKDWQETCQWLATQPEGSVFTEWSYGYWVMAIGKHPATSPGGGAVLLQQQIAVSDNLTWAADELKKENVRYIIIDKVMIEDNLDLVIQETGSGIDKERTFIFQLYYPYEKDSLFKLVHWQGDVKVFEIIPDPFPLNLEYEKTLYQNMMRLNEIIRNMD